MTRSADRGGEDRGGPGQLMLSDGCAGISEEEHDAALAAFYATFGDVMDTAFVLSRLTQAHRVAA